MRRVAKHTPSSAAHRVRCGVCRKTRAARFRTAGPGLATPPQHHLEGAPQRGRSGRRSNDRSVRDPVCFCGRAAGGGGGDEGAQRVMCVGCVSARETPVECAGGEAGVGCADRSPATGQCLVIGLGRGRNTALQLAPWSDMRMRATPCVRHPPHPRSRCNAHARRNCIVGWMRRWAVMSHPQGRGGYVV